MDNFTKSSENVFVAKPGEIAAVGAKEISILKKAATQSPLKRARICAHSADGMEIHEMIIVLAMNCYVRPHKHTGKSESFHLIEGEGEVIFFDDLGTVIKRIEVGPHASFFFRVDQEIYHTMVPRSEFLVFHEVTKGPFNRAHTIFAEWSPEEGDADGVRGFLNSLERDGLAETV